MALEEKIMQELQEIKEAALLSAKPALTMDDAALYTGLTKSYLYKLVCEKKIPYYKSAGGKLTYFKREELTDWLLAYRVQTDTEQEQAAINYVIKKGGRV